MSAIKKASQKNPVANPFPFRGSEARSPGGKPVETRVREEPVFENLLVVGKVEIREQWSAVKQEWVPLGMPADLLWR